MNYLISAIIGLLIGWIVTRIEQGRGNNFDLFTYIECLFGALFGVFLFDFIMGARLTIGFDWLEAILWSLLGIIIIKAIGELFIYTDEELRKIQNEIGFAHDYKPKQKSKSKKTKNKRKVVI